MTLLYANGASGSAPVTGYSKDVALAVLKVANPDQALGPLLKKRHKYPLDFADWDK